MGTTKQLAWDTFFYGGVYLLQNSFGLLLTPIYTRIFSQTDYGNLDLFMVTTSFLLCLLDLQFHEGYFRFYPEAQRQGRGGVYTTTLMLTVFVLTSLAILAAILLGRLGLLESSYLISFRDNTTAYVVALTVIPIHLVYNILITQARILRARWWYATGALLNMLTLSLTSIVLVVYMHAGLLGVATGQLCGIIVAASVLMIGMRPNLKFGFDRALLAQTMRYALPVAPGAWINFASSYINRFFIFGQLGAASTGVYAVASKSVRAVILFSASFAQAWKPLAMSAIGEKGSEQFYIQSLRIFTGGALFALTGLTVIARPLTAFLAPPQYSEAAVYLPILSLATIITELGTNLHLGNQIVKRTWYMSLTSLLSLLVNVAVLSLLLKYLGLPAAALGMILSSSARLAVTWYTAQRNHHINYDRRAIALLLLASGAMCGVSILLLNQPWALVAALLLLIGVPSSWYIFPRSQRQMAVTILKRQIQQRIRKN